MARVRRVFDVAILGGGGMGSSIAYWLGRLNPAISVAVIERDPTYTYASSALSVGSLRTHFSLEENIRMSQFSLGFIRDVLELPFDEGGYAFLAPSGPGGAILRENAALQQSLGADVELFEGSASVQRRFPWLNTDGVEAASAGNSGEGWFDPYLLTTSMKKVAEEQGQDYVRGTVIGINTEESGAIKGVVVDGGDGSEQHIECGTAVVAGGCWSAELVALALAGRGATAPTPPLDLLMPVKPRKRQVFVFQCAEKIDPPVPLLVDVSGFYVRRDGHPHSRSFLCGGMEGKVAEDPDREGVLDDLEVDYDYFYDELWPRLAHRVPAFEAIKLTSAWAGFYDYNTWDQNALLGSIPTFSNFLCATGFSGHGIQQVPAAGRAIAELIVHGEYRSQPGLSIFDVQRVIEGTKTLERNIV